MGTKRWDRTTGLGPPELIGRRVPPPVSATPPRRKRHWLARLAFLLLLVLLAPAALIALYRVVPPPITPLMLIRNAEGLPTRQQWVPLSRISPALAAAVMTTEDQNFCRHQGFDVEAIRAAWATYEQGGRLRGASTISQQTAKNLFLWPGQDIVRKGLEAYLTVWLELLWPKQRILEVYLNIIEWGPGIYGAEAAAQAHFNRPAASLTRQQAALLASVLPNPRQWSPTRPGPHVERRAAWAMARMDPFMRGCT